MIFFKLFIFARISFSSNISLLNRYEVSTKHIVAYSPLWYRDFSILKLFSEANEINGNSRALNNGYIPANKVYLPISSSDAAATANGITLLKPAEYAVAASISKVMSEDKSAKEGIYTLTGVKVKEDNNTNNLPRGIYIIDGKKQVIR